MKSPYSANGLKAGGFVALTRTAIRMFVAPAARFCPSRSAMRAFNGPTTSERWKPASHAKPLLFGTTDAGLPLIHGVNDGMRAGRSVSTTGS